MNTLLSHFLFLKRCSVHYLLLGILLSITTCCGNSPQPPPSSIALGAAYKTPQGKDLLYPGSLNSFKKKEIKVVSKIDSSGHVKEIYLNGDEKGIVIFFDDELSLYFLNLNIPTNADKKPIETIVTLSPTDTDTVTYTFGKVNHPYFPDKIYYNKILAWEEANIPKGGRIPPIVVIKQN
jgi:hypothetical protein